MIKNRDPRSILWPPIILNRPTNMLFAHRGLWGAPKSPCDFLDPCFSPPAPAKGIACFLDPDPGHSPGQELKPTKVGWQVESCRSAHVS
eukprot:94705-Pelagomonas_calceolata.AAC.1